MRAARHTTTKEKIHLDTMISALGVLVDNLDSRYDTGRDLAVRAAALDAAITHMAGDGCKIADSAGNGNPVVGCARTFERYLTGETGEAAAELMLNISDALRQAYRLLSTGQADEAHVNAADLWASSWANLLVGIDTLLERIGAESADDRNARQTGGR